MLGTQQQAFVPERRQGMRFHAAAAVILLLLGGGILFAASEWVQGSLFVLWMMLLLAIVVFLPWVLYRWYALRSAVYLLERDGLRLRWGLRSEDIPLTEVEWVRPAAESGYHVPQPLFSWPGALLGTQHVHELGDVEFVASDMSHLLLIATTHKVYAISPQDTRAFVSNFQRALELGSLSPLKAHSARPAAFLRQVLQDRLAKILLPLNLILCILLWIFAGFVVTNSQTLPMGFSPQGLPLERVPSEQLLLLPVLGSLVLVMNVVMGLYFFRRLEERMVAYLFWLGGVITPVLLIVAILLLSSAN
jgi:hypothetical protein